MSLWDPYNLANIENPYPMYAQLRNHAPVYKAQTGEWVLTKYDHIQAVLKDRSFKVGNRQAWLKKGVDYLSYKGNDLSYILKAIDKFILQLNPPAHTHIRKFIASNWKSREVEDIIRRNVVSLIDKNEEIQFDIVKHISSQLPALNISHIFGLPARDYELLHHLSEEIIKALDLYLSLQELIKLNEAAGEFVRYFDEMISTNQYEEGLYGRLISQNTHLKNPLTKEELISLFIFLFVAGEETSASFLSTSIYHLIGYDLYKSDIQTEALVEELLRYDSPVQLLGRIASHDCSIGGERIKQNDTLVLCIAAANRDPEIFNNPDKLVFNRAQTHLTFGRGIHYCMGDWLARITAEIALKELRSRLPNLYLPPQQLVWNRHLSIRSMKQLVVSKYGHL